MRRAGNTENSPIVDSTSHNSGTEGSLRDRRAGSQDAAAAALLGTLSAVDAKLGPLSADQLSQVDTSPFHGRPDDAPRHHDGRTDAELPDDSNGGQPVTSPMHGP